MLAYTVRRLLLLIPTLLLVTIIVFFAVRFIPGNVIEMMVAQMTSQGTVADIQQSAELIKERLGMDTPVHLQYARWLGVWTQKNGEISGVLEGNLGNSLWTGTPVSQELSRRLPISIELGGLGIILSIIIALPIGVYSAIRQDTPGDYIGRTIAILMISVPSFWLGTMVIVYPSIWWNWMPRLEYVNIWENPIENLQQIMIPAIITGFVACGAQMRMTRTMMLEVLRQDYIRTAWSKGLTERTVIIRHAMKNAMIPVVTMIGNRVPIIIGGEVVMETIFNIPGVGRYLIDALNNRDYPIISAINLVLAFFILVVNLVVDLTYAWLDPRVQYN